MSRPIHTGLVQVRYPADILFLHRCLCEHFTMPAHRRRTKTLLVALFALAVVAIAYAISENRPWKVPEEAKQRVNPIAPSPTALAAAKSIYRDKCANCHGDTGKGDGSDAASYYPRPTNLADPSTISVASDGELFYKISEGHKPMPSFKRKLTLEQRWDLVLLVRSFSQANAPAAQPNRATH